jgi:Ca2+-transporting ATPase
LLLLFLKVMLRLISTHIRCFHSLLRWRLGLPLAVTLALAFATKRMTRERLLVRVLGSCETMANSTVVCTDKTGTLTQNVMTVVAGAVGVHGKFVQQIDQNDERSPVGISERGGTSDKKFPGDFAFDMKELNSVLSPAQKELFNAAIAINSTAFEDHDAVNGELTFVGSKTETALLRFAKELKWSDYRQTRESAETVQMIPFSSKRKAMGVVVKIGPDRWRFYVKGASEILTKLCSKHIAVGRESTRDVMDKYGRDEIETAVITELEEKNIQRTIIFYANQMLRTIALCYRDFEKWPPADMDPAEEVPYTYLAQDLTLIGVTGIEDPLRPGVRDAVAQCLKAGVAVKMCTGDNVLTARSIATQCGIYTAGGLIMEGPSFRRLDEHELQEIVPRLQVRQQFQVS